MSTPRSHTAPDRATWWWWTLLRAVSVLNLGLLGFTATAAPTPEPADRVSLGCAAVYTAVCAFRSTLPRIDLERTVLVDHWLSSIALGRSLATVAELLFTVQCALFLERLARETGVGWLQPVALSLVPLIAAAQVCCWLGVLTLNHLWHAAEEALWAVMMALLGAGFVAAWPHATGPGGAVLPLGLVGCAAGAFVMVGLDIPMYLRRWRAEVAAGDRFLSIPEGIRDAVGHREQTGAWEVWRHEVAWMTPYFSVGVWFSLALVWL